MKPMYRLSLVVITLLFIASCGAAGKEKKGELNDKKSELVKLKDEQAKLNEQIRVLEDEIVVLDPNAIPAKPKLVTTNAVSQQDFKHYIDLQGLITTENIYYVSPRGMGGQVRAIYVKEGQPVKKGQLVVKLDDALIRQQIDQAKIQLDYVKDLYQRRKNLWDKNIGTEVEVISARNNVTNAEKQIEMLNEQLAMTSIYALVSGIAEQVSIRVGETLSPQSASMSGIRIVNTSDLKAEVDIPENYISKIKRGTPVIIEVPDANKTFNSTISLISQVIDPTSRGFTAEAKIPAQSGLKPNSIAMMRIQDYTKADAITVPLNTIQTDEKGKFVLVAVTEGGKKIAKKKAITLGELYNDRIEVRAGLQAGDELITDGFQNLYEGQLITTDIN